MSKRARPATKQESAAINTLLLRAPRHGDIARVCRLHGVDAHRVYHMYKVLLGETRDRSGPRTYNHIVKDAAKMLEAQYLAQQVRWGFRD